MSVSVTINGTSYTIPVTGETGWGANVTSWIQAASVGLLQKSGGSFTLTADADFGASFGLKSVYYKSQTANGSSSGVLRLAVSDLIAWRNNANSANLGLGVDSSDRLVYNGTVIIGGTSSTTANRALVSDAFGATTASSVTSTELGYVSGVTSAIQTQINTKISASSSDVITNKTIDGDTNTVQDLPLTAIKTVIGDASKFLVRDGSGIPVSSKAVPSGVVVGDTDTQTLSSKTLTTPVIDVIQATDQGSTPASPSAGTTKVYSKTDGKVYKLTSAGVEQELGAGAGGGSINYISANPDAETATTGWSTYKEASPGTLPVLATGGAADAAFTFTRTTSGPLRGTGSFLITTTAANLQGNAVSYPFTLNTADQAKVLSISFDYNVASGTFATGDTIVYIYDVTNSQLIQPAGYQIQALGSTLANKHIATFQTSSSGTSYKLIFHRSTANLSASTMKIDNVQVGPRVVQYGAPITDWADITVTLVGATNNTDFGGQTTVAKGRRVGDSLQFTISTTASGAFTGGSGLYQWKFSNYTIDSTKLATSSSARQVLGQLYLLDASPVAIYTGDVIYTSANGGGLLAVHSATAGAANEVNTGTPITPASGDVFTIEGMIPITGWSSTVQMSNDTDTRVVAARYTGLPPTGTLNSSLNNITYGTKVTDTHNSMSGATYTVPVPGYYDIHASYGADGTYTANHTTTCYILVDGTIVARGQLRAGGVVGNVCPQAIAKGIFINAGGTVTVQSQTEASSPTFTNAAGLAVFSIERQSGPSAIAASESVNARYVTTAGASIPNTGDNIVDFATIDYSSHGNVTTGAAWKFTANISGKYSLKAMLTFQSAAYGVGDVLRMAIFKSGVLHQYISRTPIMTTTAILANTVGDGEIRLLAGEYIDLRILNNRTAGATNLTTTAGENWISIKRIGEY